MASALQIPTEQDWGDYKSDFDQKDAYKVFFGKSFGEAIPDFERNVIERANELQFIAPTPFRYYMLAMRNYVMSKNVLSNTMASDAASCFLRLVKLKLLESPETIMPIMDELMPALEYVGENQAIFDADIDIYGDFREKVAEIKNLEKAVTRNK